MAFVLLIMWIGLLFAPMMKLRFYQRTGQVAFARKRYRLLAFILGLGIYGCMAGQLILLWRDGQLTVHYALPLHLCSFTGVLMLPMLLSQRQLLWEFCFYLGVPGALLALIFPSIVTSSWQDAMDFCFITLHCLIVIAPFLPLCLGKYPRPKGVVPVFLCANVFMALVMLVNSILNTNYLFLSIAPEGTPLALLHQAGLGWYLIGLDVIVLLILCAQGLIVKRFFVRCHGLGTK